MLRIDLSKDHKKLVLFHEDGHEVALPASTRGLDLLLELLRARHNDKPVPLTIGHDGNPVQYDVDRYLQRPFWDDNMSIRAWLAKHPVKKIPPKGKQPARPELTLEDLLGED